METGSGSKVVKDGKDGDGADSVPYATAEITRSVYVVLGLSPVSVIAVAFGSLRIVTRCGELLGGASYRLKVVAFPGFVKWKVASVVPTSTGFDGGLLLLLELLLLLLPEGVMTGAVEVGFPAGEDPPPDGGGGGADGTIKVKVELGAVSALLPSTEVTYQS